MGRVHQWSVLHARLHVAQVHVGILSQQHVDGVVATLLDRQVKGGLQLGVLDVELRARLYQQSGLRRVPQGAAIVQRSPVLQPVSEGCAGELGVVIWVGVLNVWIRLGLKQSPRHVCPEEHGEVQRTLLLFVCGVDVCRHADQLQDDGLPIAPDRRRERGVSVVALLVHVLAGARLAQLLRRWHLSFEQGTPPRQLEFAAELLDVVRDEDEAAVLELHLVGDRPAARPLGLPVVEPDDSACRPLLGASAADDVGAHPEPERRLLCRLRLRLPPSGHR
mmetsp:Transcript_35054/g.109108  ORF Transcript_35054/g.109108 Transcript_35054/m.109108 type:complete len:277 (-) Transcript_35054:72-902(-)